jgi:hypothetical protein
MAAFAALPTEALRSTAHFEGTSIPTPHAVAESTSTATKVAFLTPAAVMVVVSFLGNYAAWRTLDKLLK